MILIYSILLYLDIILLNKNDLTIKTTFQLPEISVIISCKIIKDKNIFYIVLGCFSTILLILKYDSDFNKFELSKKIENACSNIKQGISSIDFTGYDNKFYLVTGAYDYKFRLYEVELPVTNKDKDMIISYQGNQTIMNSCVINQVKFYEDEESGSLYLFVVSDQSLLLIFNLI
jgi:hypothetical protein